MALDTGLVEWVAEAMAPLGEVTHRRMMGGARLYCDGTVFAIVADDALWFKEDAETAAAWEAAGAPRFGLEMKEKWRQMRYRRAPEEVYDDADALRHWGALGVAAGRRAPVKRRKERG